MLVVSLRLINLLNSKFVICKNRLQINKIIKLDLKFCEIQKSSIHPNLMVLQLFFSIQDRF